MRDIIDVLGVVTILGFVGLGLVTGNFLYLIPAMIVAVALNLRKTKQS